MIAPRQETCTCEGPPIILRPIRGIILLTEAMMQTDSTSLEPHNLIASDRVEGTPVRSTDGSTIGTIERLMIDKLTGKVAHAVLRSTGVGMAKRHLLIRWSRLTYDRTLAAYHVDLTERELSALSYESDIDWGDRGREIERYDDDRVKVYWGIAETW